MSQEKSTPPQQNETIIKSEQEEPKKYSIEKQHWKLFKGKYLLQFHLCNDCQDTCYHSADRALVSGKKLMVKFELCEDCVRDNIRATDYLAPPKKKAKISEENHS
jgi:hypothetical protein